MPKLAHHISIISNLLEPLDDLLIFLKNQGYEVDIYSEKERNKIKLSQSCLEAILIDNLPSLKILEEFKDHQLPIIMLGEAINADLKVKFLESGAIDYLVKPCDYREILIKIKNQINQQRRWVNLVNNSPDIISKFDNLGRYIAINSTLEKLLNCSRSDLIGKSNLEITVPEYYQHLWHSSVEKVIKTGEEAYLEFHFPVQNGFQYYQTHLIPEYNPQGSVESVLVINRNITQLKQAEQKIKESESRFQEIADQSPILIWLSDQQGNCTFVNRPWLELTGRPLAAELKYGWLDTIHPQERDRYLSKYLDYIYGQKSGQLETRFRRYDGEYRWILEYCQPRHSEDGELLGYVGCAIDISERKQLELDLVAAQANLEKKIQRDLLLRNITNAIRSSLNFSTIYQTTVEQLREALGASRVLIHSYNPQAKCQLPVIAESKWDNLPSALGIDILANYNPHALMVLNQEEAYSCENIFLDPNLKNQINLCLKLRCQSILAVRTSYKTQVNGVIYIYQSDYFRIWTREEKELLEAVAEQLGIALAQAQILEQEKQQNQQLLAEIKERQKAEIALKKSETRYRELVESQDRIMVCRWLPDGTITYVNQSFCRFFGQSKAELQGKKLSELLNSEELAAIEPVIESLLQKMSPITFEHQMTGATGESRWFSCTEQPLFDQQGDLIELQSFTVDITELKQKENTLALIAKGTALSFGQNFFTICVIHLATLLKVDYAFLSEIKLSYTEKTVSFLAFWQKGNLQINQEYNWEDLPCLQDIVTNKKSFYCCSSAQTLFPKSLIFRDLKIEGCWAMPFLNSQGEVIGHLAIANTGLLELTAEQEMILKIFVARAGVELERQRTEEALQSAKEVAETANRAKSDFLARMSHELRTPLHAILGFSELIQQQLPSDSQWQESLKIIYRSGQHLLALINDVLAMATLESRQVILEKKAVDLIALIQSLEGMVQIPAQAKGLELVFDYPSNLPPFILIDPTKLRQILLNLLDNAIKYTETGYVIFKTTYEEEALHFRIEDSGIGIASEELKLLFQPFSQTSSGRRLLKGTGLGLAISKEYVSLMGGEINVESEIGKGSIFRVILPVEISPVMETGETSDLNFHSINHNFSSYRILIVEDSAPHRQLLFNYLQYLGLNVQVSINGQEAVALCQTWSPHLIFMDLQLPLMDGYEACQQIKTLLSENPPIIIALTATTVEDPRLSQNLSIFNDLILKPFSNQVILDKLVQHLGLTDWHHSSKPDIPPRAFSFNKDELLTLPSEWRESLQEAALAMDEEKISNLLNLILVDYPQLYQQFQKLLEDFRFDLIVKYLTSL